MIRFITTVVFITLFLICSIPLFFIELIIGLFSEDIKAKSSLAIVNWAFRVCLRIAGLDLTVIGEENVPKDKAVLYVGNHNSFFDILITYVRVPRPTGYVAKKEIKKVPLLRTWMKYLYCQFMDRDDLKSGMRTIIECINLAKKGVSICIFPEGTRNKTHESMLPFHDGSFRIAKKANCPIVPMTLVNTGSIFEDQFPKIRKAHVVLEYGKPFYVTDLDPEDQKKIGAYTKNIMEETYKKNLELI
jgi:1-acyl-sn-glycerol-3-phosphate acyltransferase